MSKEINAENWGQTSRAVAVMTKEVWRCRLEKPYKTVS